MNLQERIIVDPGILVGKPVIKGTRLAVEFIIDLLANGWTNEEPISSSGNLWVSNGNYIWVDYTNGGSSLPSGVADKIYVKVLNDSGSVTEILWNMEAMNNSTNILAQYD